ncbi:MarR family transcriptional regulator [Propionibacteriaceae bacterium G57]|uniref:arsenate reductase/protein-tyrosine-phosphatase family protein n=1 Tax=Aestuariimicrobium sp. G57 TaxID=3418485 RepID=UPI003DA6DCBA
MADPLRLQMAESLLQGDLSPSEIGQRWGLSTSLVAHHVKCLVASGIAARTRSEHDGRRWYLTLRRSDPQVVAMVALGLARDAALPTRVVFVCTRNSARSKLAAAWWRELSEIPALDAGTHPAPAPHPLAVEIAAGHGLRIDPTMHQVATTVQPGDLVVAVCDHAHELLPERSSHLHWAIPDPVPAGTRDAFQHSSENLHARVSQLSQTLPPDRSTP